MDKLFWIWFIFMLLQPVYVTITMTKSNHLTWAKLGWFALGFIDALFIGFLIGRVGEN